MKVIRFLKTSGLYNRGEDAGFPADVADRYIAAGIAVLRDDAIAAEQAASAAAAKAEAEAAAKAEAEAAAKAEAEAAAKGKTAPAKASGKAAG